MLTAMILATVLQVPSPIQELAPGAQYDPAIPTLEEVVGHDFREKITPPNDVVRYMEALHTAAPDRTRLVRYGETWEGRPLVAMVVGTPERMTMIMHGIHGNETTPSGAAMAEAYHLLASQGDPDIDLVFRESLVLIEPMENPDGRARFVYQNGIAQSRWPDPDTWSAEHDEPWPGGRGNHYLFDLNRDLFRQSKMETQSKIKLFLE
jgi:hypothetical protein